MFILHNRIDHSPLFLAPDDAGGGGLSTVNPSTGSSDSPSGADDTVVTPRPKVGPSADDLKPNFSKLGGRKESEPAPPSPEKPASATPTPKAEEKPAVEPPKGQEKAPEKPKTDEKPTGATEKPATETKPAAEKKEIKLPKDDSDLDDLKPKPGASSKVIADFKAWHEKTKETRQMARQLNEELENTRKELETTKASTGKLPEDVEKELTTLRSEVQRLKPIEKYVLRESDPEFQQEFTTKLTQAEDSLFSLLKSQNLPDETAKWMKEAEENGKKGLDRFDGIWWEKNILSKIADPLLRNKVIAAIEARQNVFADREKHISEITKNGEDYLKKSQEEEHGKLLSIAKRIEDYANKLFAEQKWLELREAPKDATEEQKKAIDAHNKRVKEDVEKMTEIATKCLSRDPGALAEASFGAVKAATMEKERDEAVKERDELQKRVEELESQISGKRKAGAISEPSGAPPATKVVKKDGVRLGDSEKPVGADFSKLGR